MAKILTIDEMLEALSLNNAPEFDRCAAIIESASTEVAEIFARHFNAEMSSCGATFEGLDLQGTACAFYPKSANQALPKVLERFDQGGDWVIKPKNR